MGVICVIELHRSVYVGTYRIQGLGGSRFKVSGSGLRLGFRDLA